MEDKRAAVTALPALFADLVRCETRLYNALNDRLREQHGLTTAQYEILRYLHDHPEARVADLATEFAAGVGAISKGIDRMENLGWVERRPNPTDRRSSLLALSHNGSDLFDAAQKTFTTRLTELLADLPALTTVARTLAHLRTTLEDRRIGLPAG
ncbi:MarR family transcriptional regulator [Nocardia yunnanensis]|uniref:MarR family transcriptional regulator n=1 Tax=Nocardia yunnanensis TaxID=2382165 RepID=A0A386Z847_9NOCA|nr:MarR family transcriptional regulator [Nocardia yunnanensis]AYF73841.1 MarR family transcriptional regulator [Nocardia yunnanensis]